LGSSTLIPPPLVAGRQRPSLLDDDFAAITRRPPAEVG
jgi:hypothetical protein